ncbi:hypothetical protein C1J00_11505 [Streptomyces cahuitamycinicus]|uniref:Uncharacterized protein n=1 Tax=Streptomyces cahuitamycinicus TaxID=2070367 RepID=A0A2N8TST7_9ACTN|nr:hypothetical protein C1J00_11505 [Streptomyces cahuitamycinicus]
MFGPSVAVRGSVPDGPQYRVTGVVHAMGGAQGLLPRRAFEIWDKATGSWSFVKGSYEILFGRSIRDRRITATINV